MSLARPISCAHGNGRRRSRHWNWELKQGQPENLYGVALELLDTVPLRFDRFSKADLGYALLVAEHREAFKAHPMHLHKKRFG